MTGERPWLDQNARFQGILGPDQDSERVRPRVRLRQTGEEGSEGLTGLAGLFRQLGTHFPMVC